MDVIGNILHLKYFPTKALLNELERCFYHLHGQNVNINIMKMVAEKDAIVEKDPGHCKSTSCPYADGWKAYGCN